MKKSYLFLADGFEEIEALTVVDIMRRAEMPLVTLSINDKAVVTGAHNIPVVADALATLHALESLNKAIPLLH